MINYTTTKAFIVSESVVNALVSVNIPTTGSVAFGVWDGVRYNVDAGDTATVSGNKVLFGVSGVRLQITVTGTGVNYSVPASFIAV